MSLVNPITPNPNFDSATPPWQIALLDAWTASVNAAVNGLYSDPVSFCASINPPPAPVQLLAANFSNVTIDFPNQVFQIGTSYSTANSVFKAPFNGVFRFECSVQLQNNNGTASSVSVGFVRNAAQLSSEIDAYQFGSFVFPNAPVATIITGAVTVLLNQNDTFQVVASMGNSQLSVSDGTGNQSSWFSGSAVK